MSTLDDLLRCCTEYLIVLALGALVGLGVLAWLVRIVYNGLWQLPKATKHTWTTKAGRGTTFVSNRRVLMPGELRARQKKMGEISYRWPMVILLVVFIAACLYVIGQG